jgi:hypothetical protein
MVRRCLCSLVVAMMAASTNLVKLICLIKQDYEQSIRAARFAVCHLLGCWSEQVSTRCGHQTGRVCDGDGNVKHARPRHVSIFRRQKPSMVFWNSPNGASLPRKSGG